ncbi:hypothetical protein GCM10011339_17100 [Echinicola rosea]|uniref:Uncharacterized protein n=1 Tax=Echinicola rosea TaxID=1807691 RepID=A0ABQ1UXX6_9BACT|nr:hypothetical protein GCM10011339_17100 [Echinicola rosea]
MLGVSFLFDFNCMALAILVDFNLFLFSIDEKRKKKIQAGGMPFKMEHGFTLRPRSVTHFNFHPMATT